MASRRSSRSLEIADHLWEVLEQMSDEMGADPAVLVNQALFALAVQHGYLKPGAVQRAAPVMRAVNSPAPPPTAKRVTATTARLPPTPVKPTHFPKRDVTATASMPMPTAKTPAASISVSDDYLPGEAGLDVPLPSNGETAVIDLRRSRRLLVHVSGRAPVEVLGIAPFIIGRDPQAQLSLNSTHLSRHHAQITREENGMAIRDMGSSNGTYFGDERISVRLIEDGDEIRLGDFTLRFEYR
jgi:hypothetical protein